jgi:VCBS repeat-containing protein
MPTPNGGTTVSITNTPQAKDDTAIAGEDRILVIDVMANDLGGNGKSLYSLNQTNPLAVATSGLSRLGATVTMVNGQVTYDSTGAGALQSLALGETASDTFSYVIQLGNGALSVATVTVAVTGANDGPSLSSDPVASHGLIELANTTGAATADTASATLVFHDVDLSDTHSVILGAPAASWALAGGVASPLNSLPAAALSSLQTALDGALTSTLTDSTHTGAGSIALAFSAADKAFDFLAKNETLTVTYNVTVKDNNGATSTQAVTFKVTGTNDAPVVAADTGSHAFSETSATTGDPAAHTLAASLAFTDTDLSDTHAVAIGAPTAVWSAGTTPAATVTALTGALTSALTDSTHTGAGSVALAFSAADKAFDFLATGETLTVTYNVTVTDNNGVASTRPVTVTVTGSNDGPVLAADSGPHAITEVGGATGSAAADTASTTLTFTDVDLSDTHTTAVGAPTISWSSGAALPASLAASLTGALTTSVADSTNTGAGSVTASFTAADAAFDFLAAGEKLTVTYAVTVSDGHGGTSTQPVTVTVTGTNDGPVLAADANASHGVSEVAGATGSAAADTASATLTFTDVDLSDTHTVSIGAAAATWSGGTTPAATLTALQGALTQTLTDSTHTGAGSVALAFSAADKAFDFLAAGETLTVTYNVTVTDNNGATSTQPVTVTVTGTNDGPVLAADSGPHAITEVAGAGGSAAPDTASTTLNFTDVDLSDHHSVSVGAPAIVWTAPSAPPGTDTSAFLPSTLAASLANALSTTLADSTGTGAGSIGATFSAPDGTFDFLAAGETLTVTYNVAVSDGHGGTSTQPVTITIAGTNDAPVLAADASGPHTYTELANTTGNPSHPDVVATLTFTDLDFSDDHTATLSAPSVSWSGGATLPGGLVAALDDPQARQVFVDGDVGQPGTATVHFTPLDVRFDFLAKGETLNVTYNLTVDDGHGGTSTQPVTFVVTGTNDRPVLANDPTPIHALNEQSGLTGSAGADSVGALLNFFDVDLNDSHTVSVGAPVLTWDGAGAMPGGLAGALSHAVSATLADNHGSGTVALNFSAADSNFDFLGAGQHLTATYSVTVTDNNGAISTKQVVFRVTGTNDTPVVTAVGTNVVGAVTEDASPTHVETATGTIALTDADINDHHNVQSVGLTSTTGTHPYGSLSATMGADANGAAVVNWTYTANDNGLQSLAAGQTVVETYAVTVNDGHGGVVTQPVTITLTGTNDAPSIGTTFTPHTVDFNQTVFADPQSYSEDGLTFTSPTHMHFDSDLDGDGHPELMNHTGGSDVSFIELTGGGKFTLQDMDTFGNGDAATWIAFTKDANGNYVQVGSQTVAPGQHVVFGAAFQNIDRVEWQQPPGASTIYVDNIHYLSASAPSFALSERIGVTGQAAADVGGGSLPFTDVDLADHHTVSASNAPVSVAISAGAVPAATLAALNGALTASLTVDSTNVNTGLIGLNFAVADNKLDFLAQGQTLTVTYNVSVDDGHGGVDNKPVTFTITGANDAPIVTGAVTGVAVEGDGNVTLNALANASDVDQGTTLTVSNISATLPPGVSYDAASHSFTLNPTNGAYDHLAVGESQTVTVGYGVSDGITTTPGTVSWTVTGTNDAPVVNAQPAAPELLQNGDFEQGALGWSNTSPGGAVEAGGSGTGTYGTNDPTRVLELDANGPGSHDDVSQTVATTAGGTYTFSFDVAQRGGTNAASNTFQVLFNGQVIDTVTPGSTSMEHHSYTVISDGSTGKVEFNETGTDDSLGTIIDNVSLKAAGIEERPGLAGSSTVDAYATTLNFADVDLSDVHSVAVGNPTLAYSGNIPAGLASALTGALHASLSESGGAGAVAVNFSAADQLFDFLGAGQTLTVTYSVTVDDHNGGTSSQPVTITVLGTNDAPVVSGAMNGSGLAGGAAIPLDALAHASDLDQGAQLSVVNVPASLPAGVTYDAATHSFVLDPTNAVYGQLAAGATQTVTVAYGVSDGIATTPTSASWVITGTNHAPALSGLPATFQLNESLNVTGSAAHDVVSANVAFTDVDLTDHHTVTLGATPVSVIFSGGGLPAVDLSALNGALSVSGVNDSTGTGSGAVGVVFSAPDNQFDFLAQGQSLTVKYDVTVQDSHGATDTRQVTFVINGANDAPIVAALPASAALEGGGPVSINGLANATDVDQGSALSIVNLPALPGGVSYNAATHIFTLDPTNAAYNALSQGETKTVTVNYAVSDGIASTPAHVSWIVTGINDAVTFTGGDVQGAIVEGDGGGIHAPSTPTMTDVEPNGTMASAQLIDVSALRVAGNVDLYDATVPAISITGNVSATTDVDFYKINLTAGQFVTFDIDHTSSPRLDSFLTLYNSAGVAIASADDSNITSGASGSDVVQDSFLQFQVPTSGLYYISVTDFAQQGQSSSGPYTLNVSVRDQNQPIGDSGSFTFADADLHDTHTLTITPEGAGYVGALTAVVGDDTTGDGTGRVDWTYTVPAASVQFLAAGQTLTQIYDVLTKDGAGGTILTPVTIVVTGVNDTPVITTGDTEGTVFTSAADHITSGILNFNDADLTDTHTLSWTNVQSGAGTFTAFLIQDSTGTGTGSIYWQLDVPSGSSDTRYNITITDNHGGSTQQLITLVGSASALPAGGGNETLSATAAADTLTGGAGNDVFVFHPGTANGDHITDFAGNLSAPGDTLNFVGFGPGATFTQQDSTHWLITYNGGASHETIIFNNAPTITGADFLFS